MGEGNITIKILCSSKVQLRSYIPNKIISVFIVVLFIVTSASVVKEDGIFWDGISVTLNRKCHA